MRIRIDRKHCKFIVKPEDRKVICVYKTNPDIVEDYFWDAVRGTSFVFDSATQVKMRNYYTGIATCSPEDEWDEELGKLIAYNKMMKKFCSAFFRRLNYYFDKYDKVLENAVIQCDTMGEKWNKQIEMLDNEIRRRTK